MAGPVASARLRAWRPFLALSMLWAAIGVLPVAAAAARVISQAGVHERAGDLVLAVLADREGLLELKSFVLDNPPRLVLDLPGAVLASDLPAVLPVEVAGIRQVRLGQFQSDPPIARIVLDLTGEGDPPAWEASPGDDPRETLIVLDTCPAPVLEPPTVEKGEQGVVLLRLAGAASLPREFGCLKEPPRIYLDFTGAALAASYTGSCEEKGIREIRMGQQSADPEHPVSRVVVELREAGAYTVFTDGDDVVLAIGENAWSLPLGDYLPSGRLKGRKVVVDPGHGGKDSGAPAFFRGGPQEPFEKDIVLDIGLRLAALLKAEGAEVTMTRDDDTYVSLSGRAEIANRLKADAFVSLHCNSCDKPDTLSGTSVYFDHQHSARFAALVQNELVAALGTVDKGVRNANFAVIRRARVPGVLVETAFINHKEDRARLLHPRFRERAARAITAGLIRFLGTKSAEGGAGT